MKNAQCVGAGSTFGDSGGARLCDPSLCRGWLHCATAAMAAAVTAATALLLRLLPFWRLLLALPTSVTAALP